MGRYVGTRVSGREPVTAAEVAALALVCVAFLGVAGMAHARLVAGLETRQAVRDALDDFGFVVGAARAGYRLEEIPGIASASILATCIRGPGTGGDSGSPGCGPVPAAPGKAAGAVRVRS